MLKAIRIPFPNTFVGAGPASPTRSERSDAVRRVMSSTNSELRAFYLLLASNSKFAYYWEHKAAACLEKS
jgi:hypothetical protein